MKFIIQRVTEASVSVDEQLVGSIRQGYLVLIGVCDADTQAEADRLVRKMLNLRIFSDENGKTNLSLKDVDGELLLISQLHCMRTAGKEIVRPSSSGESGACKSAV